MTAFLISFSPQPATLSTVTALHAAQRFDLELPCRDAHMFDGYAELIQERHVEVRQLRMRVPDMSPAFDLVGAEDQDRQLVWIVLVRISVAAAVQNHRVIEK